MPAVSILLTVYNNAVELPLALDSILAQTFGDFEVVAVDDGSTDASAAVLDRYAAADRRIRVIHQANTGLGLALARAGREAAAPLLARHDADDVSAPTRLARQVAYLERHPDAVLCGTWAWFIDPDEGPHLSLEVPDDAAQLQRWLDAGFNPFVHGSVMMRAAAYARDGVGYRFRSLAEDYDLWLRLSRLGRLGMVESVEYFYALSPGGVNFGNLAAQRQLVQVALRLHAEYRAGGREITDWRAAEALARGEGTHSQRPEERQTVVSYVRALHRLRLGDWTGYRAGMAAAARGQGAMALKARRHRLLAFAAPLTRALYTREFARGPQRHARLLPIGTPLPEGIVFR
jgi:glycosyltransferase involved in cell wall biosynthesis